MSGVTDHRCPCGAYATLKTPWGGMCTKCIQIEPAHDDRPTLFRQEIGVCNCSSLGHIVRVSRFIDEPDKVYVDVTLSSGRLWDRIKAAVRHVLSRDCAFGDCAEVTLDAPEAEKLAAFLRREH